MEPDGNNNEKANHEGVQIELRYALADWGVLPLNPTLYVEWVERGGIAVAAIDTKDLARIAGLMKKYADTPMDFADATLVFVADRTNTPQIMTLDNDFHVYRIRGSKAFESVL